MFYVFFIFTKLRKIFLLILLLESIQHCFYLVANKSYKNKNKNYWCYEEQTLSKLIKKKKTLFSQLEHVLLLYLASMYERKSRFEES